MQITDTAAIVTGGASGLGAATAAALAAGGARVFAFDLPASIEGAPQVDGVEYVAVDVTDPEQVQAAVDTAAGAGVPLRTVVNCAGIGNAIKTLSKDGAFPLDAFRKALAVDPYLEKVPQIVKQLTEKVEGRDI